MREAKGEMGGGLRDTEGVGGCGVYAMGGTATDGVSAAGAGLQSLSRPWKNKDTESRCLLMGKGDSKRRDASPAATVGIKRSPPPTIGRLVPTAGGEPPLNFSPRKANKNATLIIGSQ